jgi:hypothetical protein
MDFTPTNKAIPAKKQAQRSHCPTPKGKLLTIGGKESKGGQPQQEQQYKESITL